MTNASETDRRLIQLFGGPAVTVAGVKRSFPDGSKRLVALLALDRRPLERRFVAGTLWPAVDESHAAGCLRTALWRLKQADIDVLTVTKTFLQLAPGVCVDVSDADAWASRVIGHRLDPEDLMWPEHRSQALDLLPGWYDDWVVPYREHLRQRVLHALDEMSVLLSDLGRHADAVEAAYISVSCEPLRESAQRALIRAHLAEGNLAEARRAYARFARLLQSELAAVPSRGLTDMLPGASSERTSLTSATDRRRLVNDPAGAGAVR